MSCGQLTGEELWKLCTSSKIWQHKIKTPPITPLG